MNRINITIDYNKKCDSYKIVMMGESEISICNQSNIENIVNLTKNLLIPEIIFTKKAEENLPDKIKQELKNLENSYNNKK